jgi:hypothetical protein
MPTPTSPPSDPTRTMAPTHALFLGYNLVGDHFGAQRMLLRFDVESVIPPGSTVDDARLHLRLAFSSPAGDAPMGTLLRRLASPWDEFTVTWTTEPEWTPVDDTTFVGSALDWYEWEITNVESFVNQPEAGAIVT